MKDNTAEVFHGTGNPYVDGVLVGRRWVGSVITYAFPTSAPQMNDIYPWNTSEISFRTAPEDFQTAVKQILKDVSTFTLLTFVPGDPSSQHVPTATLRWGLSSDANVGSGGNFPDTTTYAGDMYFSFVTYATPLPGTGIYHVIEHELGHALGLKHLDSAGTDIATIMPAERQSNEFSVMSYNINTLVEPGTGIRNGGYIGPDENSQSYMIADIAGLQALYGANFATNAGNTVYSFGNTTGQLFINGVAQDMPSGAKIYRAIWDGGGNDTYDFGNFTTNETIDLRPSHWSTIDPAMLGGSFYELDANGNQIKDAQGLPVVGHAAGNLANPDLYNNDPRSLIENAIGGSGDDFIFGNDIANALHGGAGDDAIFSGLGADVLDGGAGNDTARYSDDVGGVPVTVDLTNNVAHGGAAEGDTFVSIENVWGTSFGDTLIGDAIANNLSGLAGNDVLVGMAGGDVLNGGPGLDSMYGGTGDDTYDVDQQGDLVFENPGEGIDSVFSTSSFYLYANIENLTLLTGTGNLFGVGNDLANILTGNEGDNTLLGGGGDDILRGGAGIDILYGQDGKDNLAGEAGNDFLAGGAGDDLLNGGTGGDSLYGEDGNDILVGGSDFVFDQLVGGNGDDSLDGASGLGDYDYLYGNAGDDSYQVDTPADLVFEQPNEGNDTVYATITGAGYYLYANIENLVLLGTTPYGVGNALDNRLTGNAIGNYLLGGSGNDTLNGKAGNDVLFGEAGSDTFVFEHGTGGDVIGDFTPGTDKIDLRAIGYTSFAQVAGAMHENGGTTAIDLGNGDVVVLNGVAAAQLHASDFILAAAPASAVVHDGIDSDMPTVALPEIAKLFDPWHGVGSIAFPLL